MTENAIYDDEMADLIRLHKAGLIKLLGDV